MSAASKTASDAGGFSGIKKLKAQRPLVAIVGRPNVGKSTLFNRLAQTRSAITNDRPGVTRDRIYAPVEWSGRHFVLTDTGGYIPRTQDAIEVAVREQAVEAIEECDLVILLVDGNGAPTDLDREVAQVLLRRETPCILAVNKIDQPENRRFLDEFGALGLGEPFGVSAITGRRTGDLLDLVINSLNWQHPEAEPESTAIKVALVGRPNVGKSTLVNRLAGQRISIVDDQPGTTRDTTRIGLEYKGRQFDFMDTAGLRRRAKVEDQVEYYSRLRASSSLEEADVVVGLIDATSGCTTQDARIMGQVIEAGRGLLLAINKWDLVGGAEQSAAAYLADVYRRYPFLRPYPSVFISGLTGRRVLVALERIAKVYDSCTRRIPTAQLNRFFETIEHQSPVLGDAKIRLFYAVQRGVSPPHFVVFANHPQRIPASYKRFLEKKLRSEFDFEGTPVRFQFRSRRTIQN